jgi:hypothetical protein
MSDAIKDRFEIIEHCLTWSAWASRMDAQNLALTFIPEGRLGGVAKLVGRPEDEIVGTDGIRDLFAPLFAGLAWVHHTSQVVEIKVSGDTATARTMIIEYARPKGDGAKMMQVIGDYIDDLVRTPKGWRFKKRVLVARSFSNIAELPMG